MKNFTAWSALGHGALFAISLLWTGYAWHILLEGSFTKSYRHSAQTTEVAGPAVTVMAFIFLSLAAIALCIVFKRMNAPRWLGLAATVALLGTPVLFLIAR